jgi:hypothetical protein
MPWTVRRLPGNPIIRPGQHSRIGTNIQGASLIQVPSWVKNPLGSFYLYFADHKGDHIRLAVSNTLHGPWWIYGDGALDLRASLFPVEPPPVPEDAPPLPEGGLFAPPGTPGVPDRDEDATLPHIASPDVHVDHSMHRFVMYYHGLAGYRTQRTRAAVSSDGINFTPHAPLLGHSYFRVFQHHGTSYAVVMPGILHRAGDPLAHFEPGPDLFNEPNQRHTALLKRDDTLYVFWTRVGDAPERILVSRVELHGDWRSWRAGPPEEVMRPEEKWEGAHLPIAPSWRGAVNIPVNQLRDPCIFEAGSHAYLLYAVAGESGIAIAELHGP